jgi:3-vinyl bacteriochlorophyllide hydratase
MSASEPTTGRQKQPLYTPAERARRDATKWTLVQGLLAPIQFLAFAISLCLVINYLLNGVGLAAATLSVVIKTSLLYAIMITGAVWEKVVFGRYLFAPAFFLGRRRQHVGDGASYGLRGDVVSRLGNAD